MSEQEHCIECGVAIEEGVLCEKCEQEEMKDPQFWLDYCHFCGLPATLEQIKKWMGVKR